MDKKVRQNMDTTSSKIRIIIADDHRMFNESIQLILDNDPESRFLVVKVFESSDALLKFFNNNYAEADIILLDIFIEHKTRGIEVLSQLRANPLLAHLKILMLTQVEEPDIIKNAIDFGANGYIMKKRTTKELANAIKYIFDTGNKYFPGLSGTQETVQKDNPIETLTPTEIKIVHHIKEAKTNKDIADELKITVNTVETHRKNIYAKLDVHNVAGLIKKLSTPT